MAAPSGHRPPSHPTIISYTPSHSLFDQPPHPSPSPVSSPTPVSSFFPALEMNQLVSSNHSPNLHSQLIKFRGRIAGKQALILLDCGSSGNFISTKFVSDHGIDTITLQDQSVLLADGTKQFTSQQIPSASVAIGTYQQSLDLAVITLSGTMQFLACPGCSSILHMSIGELKLSDFIMGTVVTLHSSVDRGRPAAASISLITARNLQRKCEGKSLQHT